MSNEIEHKLKYKREFLKKWAEENKDEYVLKLMKHGYEWENTAVLHFLKQMFDSLMKSEYQINYIPYPKDANIVKKKVPTLQDLNKLEFLLDAFNSYDPEILIIESEPLGYSNNSSFFLLTGNKELFGEKLLFESKHWRDKKNGK